jgi:transcriptional regulator with XRE-family HTH domain
VPVIISEVEAKEVVRVTRRARGLSQRQLARRSGVSQPTIARIESGRQHPSYDMVNRLLDACGMELRPVTKTAQGDGVGASSAALSSTQ